MSNLEAGTEDQIAKPPILQSPSVIDPRTVSLHTRTNMRVSRTLPHRDLRRIGPWCFIDYFLAKAGDEQMRVAAHPHTGLQTVTWLLQGEVRHQDSIGSDINVLPGQLNLMTAGFGVAHSELSVTAKNNLEGIQLWVALPDGSRNNKPSFEHHASLPIVEINNSKLKLFAGSYESRTSPATFYSPLLGAELTILDNEITITTEPTWEYGLLLISGDVNIFDIKLSPKQLLYIPAGQTEIKLTAQEMTKLILIGGEPFGEEIVMWWNFIGRSHDEINEMRNSWENQSKRFPNFTSEIPERIPAPQLPNLRLSPR